MSTPDEERSFGKYRLLDRIATGGMAEIYRARYDAAAGVSKPVVIKKILPAYAGSANFVSMFINEAKIVTGLSHGNIAQVFDFGEIDGEYFLAMELVHGFPLSKVMKKARAAGIPVLPVPYVCSVGVELCKGLHYAHTRRDAKGQPLGIIHRDVSPQNILLAFEGQVKIVDFGIAKAKHATNTETQPGAVKGKYFYFAPEQCKGEPLDARTDVYAAGVVLYEMLTGRLPIEGRMIEVFRRIIAGDFDRPRSVNANLPEELERIVLKAMAKDRTERYPSAQALGDALGRFLYSQAPTFSSGSLAHLMAYLFQEELKAEGHPLPVPPEFQRELDALRGLPATGDTADTIAELERVVPGRQTGTQRLRRATPQPPLTALRRTPARPLPAAARAPGPDAAEDDDEITMPPEAPTELAPRVSAATQPLLPMALGLPGPPVPTPATVSMPRAGIRVGVDSNPSTLPLQSAVEPAARATEELTPLVGAPPRPSTVPAALLDPVGPTEKAPPPVQEDDEPGTVPLPRVLTPGQLPAQAVLFARPPPQPLPRWIFVVLPLLVMMVAALAVMLVGARQPKLALKSEPPDAIVIVDGETAPARTPVVISDLEPDVPHTIEVRAAGHQPWQEEIVLMPGERRTVQATLRTAPPTAEDTAP